MSSSVREQEEFVYMRQQIKAAVVPRDGGGRGRDATRRAGTRLVPPPSCSISNPPAPHRSLVREESGWRFICTYAFLLPTRII